MGLLLSGVHQLAVRWYTVSESTWSAMDGTTWTPLEEVPMTATRLPLKSTSSGRPRPGVNGRAGEVLPPGDVGGVGDGEHAGGGDDEAGLQIDPSAGHAPASVPVDSWYSAELTRASKRMCRRRSKRSTTWLR